MNSLRHAFAFGCYIDTEDAKVYVHDDYGDLRRIDSGNTILDGFIVNLSFAASDGHDRFYTQPLRRNIMDTYIVQVRFIPFDQGGILHKVGEFRASSPLVAIIKGTQYLQRNGETDALEIVATKQ